MIFTHIKTHARAVLCCIAILTVIIPATTEGKIFGWEVRNNIEIHMLAACHDEISHVSLSQ